MNKQDITRRYALSLVKSGRAAFGGLCHDSNGDIWVEVNECAGYGDRQWFCLATKAQAATYSPERRMR